MPTPVLPTVAVSRALACSVVALSLTQPVEAQWRQVQAPTVVPVEALTAVPAAPGTLVASVRPAAAAGGLAHSYDDGATWRWEPSVGTPLLTSLEPHPTDPNELWGATFRLWKSADAGGSWQRVYAHTNALEVVALDPGDPDRVYAVGYVVVPGGTLHRSVDGGQSWVSTWPIYFDQFNDVVVAPNPGIGVVLLAADSGLYRSVDGGTTLTNVLSKKGIELAVGAQNPLAIWSIVLNNNGTKTRLFRSLDGGVTWTQVLEPADDLTDILAHPTDAARAWVVGTSSGAHYTVDGGQTWSAGVGMSIMAGLDSIVGSSASATTLFAGGKGGYGGIWRSNDSGVSWQPSGSGLNTPIPDLRFDVTGRAYASGLGVPLRQPTESAAWEVLTYPKGATSRVVDIATHPSDPTILAWLNYKGQFKFDRVELSTDDGATWTHVTPPTAKTWTEDVSDLAFGSAGTLYTASRNSKFQRSGNLGTTWTTRQAPWSTPIEVVPDPFSNDRVFVTDYSTLHRSADKGNTWTSHSIGAAGNLLPAELVASSTQPDLLYVLAGQVQKELFRSTDAGSTWTAIGSGLPPSGSTHLAVDPNDDGRILVAASHSLYLSLDGGETFAPFAGVADGARVTSLAFDPSQPGRAWMSTEEGKLHVHDFH
jgi:photosystem II stability/assembly factor-like uncharacterized protein